MKRLGYIFMEAVRKSPINEERLEALVASLSSTIIVLDFMPLFKVDNGASRWEASLVRLVVS